MEFSLPGAIAPEQACRQGVLRGLHVNIWEHVGNSCTRTHHFSMGLELEVGKASETSHAHLPSISVSALLHLRASLERPKAIALDTEPFPDGWSASIASTALISQVKDEVSERGQLELKRWLELSEGPLQTELVEKLGVSSEPNEMNLEALLKPEQNSKTLDISICTLPGLRAARLPILALARFLRKPESQKNVGSDPASPRSPNCLPKVRYAALLIDSPDQNGEIPTFAREVGRALATTFMNEEFVDAVGKVPRNNPEKVFIAFDSYLSQMTIVPTVHMLQNSASNQPVVNGIPTADYLLSDSLVQGMEKHICSMFGVAQKQDCDSKPVARKSHSGRTPSKNWAPSFVEVDNLTGGTKKWQMTRLLRKGLELELDQGGRPHLPHIALKGLTRVRELIVPQAIGLDVPSESLAASVDAVVKRVVCAGLPTAMAPEIKEALMERATGAALAPVNSSPQQGQPENKEMMKPSADDEACLILELTSPKIPKHQDIIGAFVRLASSVEITCASRVASTRFLLVLAGPVQAQGELAVIGDSLAALVADEDLMGNLMAATDVQSFIAAVDARLDDLILMPRAPPHVVHGVAPRNSDDHGTHDMGKTSTLNSISTSGSSGLRDGCVIETTKKMIARMQKYSLPLVSGVLIALIWSNVHEASYLEVTHKAFFDGKLLGHEVHLHFIVNDIFMCFFFGLAIKEVTEALLPGGSLSPLSRAVNPLMACFGGVVGPIIVYLLGVMLFDAAGAFDGQMCMSDASSSGGEHRRLGSSSAPIGGQMEPCSLEMLLNGWGIPTATDISLAWMFALLIFGAGHPAINFLLLLAIVDDALGMMIIAAFYPDPHNPVEPVWALLILAAMMLAFMLRVILARCHMQCWSIYVLVCGPIAWLGLLKAHVHPALALVFVVPFMPGTHVRLNRRLSEKHLGAVDWATPDDEKDLQTKLKRRLTWLATIESAPLHTFEHHLKLPVDLGMFFFGLANAGVKFNAVGGITACIVLALAIGKTLGIACFGLLSVKLGFDLPVGVTTGDLFALSALAGVGLTVALFVANEAFIDPGLQGQAKMGALISVVCAGLAWAIRSLSRKLSKTEQDEHDADGDMDVFHDGNQWIDDLVIDDVLRVITLQRKYSKRGTAMPLQQVARSVSKESLNIRNGSKSPQNRTSGQMSRQVSPPTFGLP